MTLGEEALPPGQPALRAARGIARTFQTPRVIGEASVLQNVMIGGTHRRNGYVRRGVAVDARATTATSACCRPRRTACSAWVGLEALADVRADRLQHSELRFIEIAARADARSRFPAARRTAAGLSSDEIDRLAALIQAISRRGTGVLLVEHHADLIFEICDEITVLNLGRILAAGTAAEIRSHKEVVSAYLGA